MWDPLKITTVLVSRRNKSPVFFPSSALVAAPSPPLSLLLLSPFFSLVTGDTEAILWVPSPRRQGHTPLHKSQALVIDTAATYRSNINMPRGVKKEHLPTKTCVVCQRPFNWRKKWERCWDQVTTCSKSCNQQRRALQKQRTNTSTMAATRVVSDTAAATPGTKSDEPSSPNRDQPAQTDVENNDVLQHYKFTVAYNGARFHGFQRQAAQPKQNNNHDDDDDNHKRPHLGNESKSNTMQSKTKKGDPVTIQGCLEQAFLQYAQQQQQQQNANKSGSDNDILLTLSDLRVRFAGRTDKGVHARGQVVTCFLPSRTTATMGITQELQCLKSALNSRLPDEISIQAAQTVEAEFDPRRDARVSKVYSYRLKFRQITENGQQQPQRGMGIHSFRSALDDVPPLWLVPWPLYQTHQIWPALCQQLQGTHDYRSFVHKDERRGDEPHILMVDLIDYQVQRCTSSTHSHIITAQFEFHAAGFRRGMVRHLVGFLVQCARKPWSLASNRDAAMPPVQNLWNDLDTYWKPYIESAPASGLCLESVTYDPENERRDPKSSKKDSESGKEASLHNAGDDSVSEQHALSQILLMSGTTDRSDNDDDDDFSTTSSSSDKGESEALPDSRAARKAAKKAKKAARRAQREGRADPSVGQKTCDVCGKSVDLLIRCTIDASGDWKMVCGKCWHTVSGGVVDGSPNHPHYRYGGLWKNRAKK